MLVGDTRALTGGVLGLSNLWGGHTHLPALHGDPMDPWWDLG